MTLIGPADADHYRIKQGRSRERWYVDPLPADSTWQATSETFPSISSLKPPFANRYVTMKTVAQMASSEWFRLANITPEQRYDHIKSHDRIQGGIAMDRGSIVHAWAEDLIAGRAPAMPLPTDAAEAAAPYLPALQSFFDAWQPVPVAVETVCINRSLNGVGYGGTCDLIAEVNGGVYVVDWKSRGGDHAAYLEDAAQVAGYAAADYMIAQGEDGQPYRAAIPDLDGALIVSIRADGFRVYPIDINEGRHSFETMHAWWAAQREDASVGNPWPPQHVPAPTDFGTPKTERIGQLRTRLSIVHEFGGVPMADIKAAWPPATPPLTADPAGITDLHLDAIEAITARLEAANGIHAATSADEVAARVEALPPDLLRALTLSAKRLTPPVPNLADKSLKQADIDRLVPLLESAEAQAATRLVELVNATEGHDVDAIIEWATEQRPQGPADDLGALDFLEARRVQALAAMYDAIHAGALEDTPAGILEWLTERHGSKTAVNNAAKFEAEHHGIDKPGSAGAVAADRMLAALTHQHQPESS